VSKAHKIKKTEIYLLEAYLRV